MLHSDDSNNVFIWCLMLNFSFTLALFHRLLCSCCFQISFALRKWIFHSFRLYLKKKTLMRCYTSNAHLNASFREEYSYFIVYDYVSIANSTLNHSLAQRMRMIHKWIHISVSKYVSVFVLIQRSQFGCHTFAFVLLFFFFRLFYHTSFN